LSQLLEVNVLLRVLLTLPLAAETIV